MPNFSGIWSAAQQFQARGQNIWPKPPDAPTIGTATAGNSLCASVTFTAPACTGKYPAGVSSYTVTSTPGCVTASGAASPLTVTGLTNATSYTFKVKATGSNGLIGPCSAASNSITASNAGQQAYTSAGSYSWVAPSGVTSVSVVAVGGGGAGGACWYYIGCCQVGGNGGGGGGLGYKNNYSVTPGNSYTVVVGARGITNKQNGGDSYFVNTSTVKGGGGAGGSVGGSYTGDGGGNGGAGGSVNGQCARGGGGAGGYSGTGGAGGASNNGSNGAGGGGGGGKGSNKNTNRGGGGGGGVGILGQGCSGVGATTCNAAGGGGSSGANGFDSTTTRGGSGGAYGGAGGGRNFNGSGCNQGEGAVGAVRIIWPGTTRQFPSTNTGDL